MVQQKAVSATDSSYFPGDLEKESIGIRVTYGDKKGWMEAFDCLSSHQEKVRKWG